MKPWPDFGEIDQFNSEIRFLFKAMCFFIRNELFSRRYSKKNSQFLIFLWNFQWLKGSNSLFFSWEWLSNYVKLSILEILDHKPHFKTKILQFYI